MRTLPLTFLAFASLAGCDQTEESVANRFERTSAEIENKARDLEAEVANQTRAAEAALENEGQIMLNRLEEAADNVGITNESR